MLILSPAYLWEVAVKSDLMSNVFLVIIFIYLWKQKTKNIFEKYTVLSLFIAFFILTRGVVYIPLILFLFSDFIKIDTQTKIKFIVWLLFFLLLFSIKIKNNLDIFYFSLLIFGALIFSAFIMNIYEEGFYNNVINDLFDLSYFGILIPFAMFSVIKKNTMHA